MTLADPYEEYDDLIEAPTKRGKAKNKIHAVLLKARFALIILVIGMICGILFGHLFIEPLLATEETSVCKTCILSKELLAKENVCLYTLLDNAGEQVTTCTNLDN
jgi:hypothetical protein